MEMAAEGGDASRLPEIRRPKEEEAYDSESETDMDEEGRGVRIPLHRWVMHGTVMFGREFCYAMETALVTPVLLQIGLPEKYYSLTWFLSPILGLLFTPLIGTASDRCSLRWGRRRPFILGLCVGVLLGVALFLNGSLIGLSVGDTPNKHTIGIVLTVLGVVVLDFCADASEGPIRAYLLDVADTDEQDIALNIHAFSAGLGGAIGYMLGGLDWTGTALGQAFQSQEQVLFMFAAIVFIISVTLHMFSIPEQPFSPSNQVKDTENGDSTGQVSLKPAGRTLDVITEEDASRVRSKSDSVLAMPDATIELDADLDPDTQNFLPETHFQPEMQEELEDVFKLSDSSAEAPPSFGPQPPPDGMADMTVMKTHGTKPGNHTSSTQPGRPTYYRQPSFTFSYYGRVGAQRHRMRHTGHFTPRPITTSQSLNDLSIIQRHTDRRRLQLSASSVSSEGSSSEGGTDKGGSVRLLWLSMLKMPSQLWRLCVCHLLTWFSIIAEAVFYTDFMGQVIFQGDPKAPANSTELQNYHKGVQMGCWGLVVYAATAAVCSAILQKYLDHFDLSIRVIYILGTLGFSVGTAVMAIIPNVYVAMVMISTMGIISMSISYCPYALLGQYHEIKEYINHSPENTRRGFGIDCAILTCQVYISQILVASALGSVVEAVGSVRVIPIVASGGSFLGFLAACFLLIYPDLEPSSSEQDEDSVGFPGVEDQNAENTSEQTQALLKLTNTDTETESSIMHNVCLLLTTQRLSELWRLFCVYLNESIFFSRTIEILSSVFQFCKRNLGCFELE
uniref:Solute carrier family 45 member 4b n=1 Tax=Astatotilapia calliptera TaxID=8154 RepID=A0AAX7SLN3_ASTCA